MSRGFWQKDEEARASGQCTQSAMVWMVVTEAQRQAPKRSSLSLVIVTSSLPKSKKNYLVLNLF